MSHWEMKPPGDTGLDEAAASLRSEFEVMRAEHDRLKRASSPTLATKVEALEDRARRLEDGWGEMLAMMCLERNREAIRKGDPEHIDELFRICDTFKARYEASKGL